MYVFFFISRVCLNYHFKGKGSPAPWVLAGARLWPPRISHLQNALQAVMLSACRWRPVVRIFSIFIFWFDLPIF